MQIILYERAQARLGDQKDHMCIYIYMCILILPSIVMQYSSSLFLHSSSMDFIHQLKQELTCDIDSYGTHEVDLYS